MWLLQRLRFATDWLEANDLALVRRLALGPEHPHRLDRFARLFPACAKFSTHHFGFFPEPTRADAEDHASAGEQIETRDGLGRNQRFSLGQETDSRSEFDFRRHRRRHGKPDKWIGPTRIMIGKFIVVCKRERSFHIDGNHWMLGNPERFIAERFD